jgi:predicted permease
VEEEIMLDEVAAKILPILLLIALGNVLRAGHIIAESTIGDLKSIVVDIALPSVFFLSFLALELDRSYLALAALIFGICTVQLFYGRLVNGALRLHDPYFPFLATGFELGMVGITLFGAAYGLENVGAIGVFGIGHEFFVWFILVTLLIARRDGSTRIGVNLIRFVTSPVIIAIFSGILCNLLGLGELLRRFVVTGALLTALDYLSKLTIPLILIIVGYGMKVSLRRLGRPLLVVVARLVLLIPLALLLNRFVIENLLNLDPLFSHALFTILILPPPYVIPIFMNQESREDLHDVNNTLTLHTIVTIGVFIAYQMITSTR